MSRDDYIPVGAAPKSRAMPPLYLLRCPEGCLQCGETTRVYALAARGLYDADEDDTFNGLLALTHIERLPRRILELFQDDCPTWSFDREEPADVPYLMNHCRHCAATLTDHDIHHLAGAAFCPMPSGDFGNITVFTLPVDEEGEIPITCSWATGLDEVLDFEQAEPYATASRSVATV